MRRADWFFDGSRPLLLRKCRPVPILFASVWILSWGCANEDIRLGAERPDAQAPPPGLASPPNEDAAAKAPEILACIGTTCPAPFATCTSSDGPTYKCGTDIAHDPKNCGACGNECLVYSPRHLTSRCVNGACELECLNDPWNPEDRRNCNGVIDDGCEVDVLGDPKNCGACGKACAAGAPCINGACGCPPPLIACNGYCVDPNTDDYNCGECNKACEPPPDGCEIPGAYYGCVGGTCGHIKCNFDMADCNNDIGPLQCSSDGCEVHLTTDLNNCGTCGAACKPNEACIDEGFGRECGVRCARFGKVLCPVNGQCIDAGDLLSDPSNCGTCGHACPLPGANQVSLCKKGLCDYECAPGYGDCNGDAADGCETNLKVHPANCGSCENRCDITAGQPCVEGKCLMTTCDGEETQ